MPYNIGLDVGGTKVLGVAVSGGKILKKKQFAVSRKTPEDFFNELLSTVEVLAEGKKYSSIDLGICLPGFVDKGVLKKAPNLKFMEGFDFERKFSKKGFKKVSADNDGKCFALGESVRLKEKNLVGLTLGTGIGCGIIIDGKIYRGKGSSGELSHTIVEPNGRKCSCGNLGCLEEYFSKRALLRETKKVFGRTVDAYELRKLSEKGNKKALKACKNLGFYLGIGLANISNIIDPQVISISGGLSKNKLLVRIGKEEMKRWIYAKEPKVVLGKYESAAVGAANL
jgi:predicted NBD/HSP70 family sugar kinase